MMQDLVGDYDLPDTVVEWKWVADNASYHHRHNGQLGVYEFMLNLSRTFDDVPERLQAVLASSKQAGIAYLLVHQGT